MSDFFLDISRGKTKFSRVNVFGRNFDVDTGGAEDIWNGGGLYVPPTTCTAHNISSSNVADTGTLISSGEVDLTSSKTKLYDSSATFTTDGVAVGDAVLNDSNLDHGVVVSIDSQTSLTVTMHKGYGGLQPSIGDDYRIVTPGSTGASVVRIQGLNSLMELVEEFVILNGTTPVSTVNTCQRINYMTLVGALNRLTSNVGDISAVSPGDTTTTCIISSGDGRSLSAFYTVPANTHAYLIRFHLTLNKTGQVDTEADLAFYSSLFAPDDGAGQRIEHVAGLHTAGSSHIDHDYGPYERFSEKTDLWLRCESVSANDCDISGCFDLILEPYTP